MRIRRLDTIMKKTHIFLSSCLSFFYFFPFSLSLSHSSLFSEWKCVCECVNNFNHLKSEHAAVLVRLICEWVQRSLVFFRIVLFCFLFPWNISPLTQGPNEGKQRLSTLFIIFKHSIFVKWLAWWHHAL